MSASHPACCWDETPSREHGATREAREVIQVTCRTEKASLLSATIGSADKKSRQPLNEHHIDCCDEIDEIDKWREVCTSVALPRPGAHLWVQFAAEKTRFRRIRFREIPLSIHRGEKS